MESKKEDSQDLSLQNMEDFEYAKQCVCRRVANQGASHHCNDLSGALERQEVLVKLEKSVGLLIRKIDILESRLNTNRIQNSSEISKQIQDVSFKMKTNESLINYNRMELQKLSMDVARNTMMVAYFEDLKNIVQENFKKNQNLMLNLFEHKDNLGYMKQKHIQEQKEQPDHEPVYNLHANYFPQNQIINESSEKMKIMSVHSLSTGASFSDVNSFIDLDDTPMDDEEEWGPLDESQMPIVEISTDTEYVVEADENVSEMQHAKRESKARKEASLQECYVKMEVLNSNSLSAEEEAAPSTSFVGHEIDENRSIKREKQEKMPSSSEDKKIGVKREPMEDGEDHWNVKQEQLLSEANGVPLPSKCPKVPFRKNALMKTPPDVGTLEESYQKFIINALNNERLILAEVQNQVFYDIGFRIYKDISARLELKRSQERVRTHLRSVAKVFLMIREMLKDTEEENLSLVDMFMRKKVRLVRMAIKELGISGFRSTSRSLMYGVRSFAYELIEFFQEEKDFQHRDQVFDFLQHLKVRVGRIHQPKILAAPKPRPLKSKIYKKGFLSRENLKKLNDILDAKLEELITPGTVWSHELYIQVRRVALIKISQFCCQSPCRTSSLTLAEWAKARNNEYSITDLVNCQQSDEEEIFAKIKICLRRDEYVDYAFIFFPANTWACLDALADPAIRKVCGVSEANEFLFPAFYSKNSCALLHNDMERFFDEVKMRREPCRYIERLWVVREFIEACFGSEAAKVVYHLFSSVRSMRQNLRYNRESRQASNSALAAPGIAQKLEGEGSGGGAVFGDGNLEPLEEPLVEDNLNLKTEVPTDDEDKEKDPEDPDEREVIQHSGSFPKCFVKIELLNLPQGVYIPNQDSPLVGQEASGLPSTDSASAGQPSTMQLSLKSSYQKTVVDLMLKDRVGRFVNQNVQIYELGLQLYREKYGKTSPVKLARRVRTHLRWLACIFLKFKENLKHDGERSKITLYQMFNKEMVHGIKKVFDSLTIQKGCKTTCFVLLSCLRTFGSSLIHFYRDRNLLDSAKEVSKFLKCLAEEFAEGFQPPKEAAISEDNSNHPKPAPYFDSNYITKEDIKKMDDFLNQKLNNLTTPDTADSYVRLRRLTLTKLSHFCCQNLATASGMTVAEWTQARNHRNLPKLLTECPEETRNEILNKVKILHKPKNNQLMLVPSVVWASLDTLANEEVRTKCGLTKDNKYMFPAMLSPNSPVRLYNDLDHCYEEANVIRMPCRFAERLWVVRHFVEDCLGQEARKVVTRLFTSAQRRTKRCPSPVLVKSQEPDREEVEVEKTTCTDQRKEEEEQIRKEEEPEQSNDGEAQKISAESGISDSGSNPIGPISATQEDRSQTEGEETSSTKNLPIHVVKRVYQKKIISAFKTDEVGRFITQNQEIYDLGFQLFQDIYARLEPKCAMKRVRNHMRCVVRIYLGLLEKLKKDGVQEITLFEMFCKRWVRDMKVIVDELVEKEGRKMTQHFLMVAIRVCSTSLAKTYLNQKKVAEADAVSQFLVHFKQSFRKARKKKRRRECHSSDDEDLPERLPTKVIRKPPEATLEESQAQSNSEPAHPIIPAAGTSSLEESLLQGVPEMVASDRTSREPQAAVSPFFAETARTYWTNTEKDVLFDFFKEYFQGEMSRVRARYIIPEFLQKYPFVLDVKGLSMKERAQKILNQLHNLRYKAVLSKRKKKKLLRQD